MGSPESIVKGSYPQVIPGAPAIGSPTMRVALVSPYSWTYPGGVTRHIEALATELAAAGHEIRVFAPFDPDTRPAEQFSPVFAPSVPDTRAARLRHRGARLQAREVPEWLAPLGGTIGW